MRKKKFIYAALALLTLGFTGCSQEEDFAPQGGDGQEISIRTRAADSGSETEPFTGNFTLELWNDGVHTTHPMTYTESTGWNAVKVDKLGTSVTALAHCGNTVNVTSSGGYSIELTENQSTDTAFLAADVMIATGTVDQDGALSLNFEHYFAKVTFRIAVIGSEFDTTEGEIKTLKVVTNDGIEVITCADDNSYTAIITPYWYTSADETFVKVYMNDDEEPLTVKVPADFVGEEGGGFRPGTHYTFSLKVGKNKVTIELISTDDIGSPFGSGWDNDSETDLN